MNPPPPPLTSSATSGGHSRNVSISSLIPSGVEVCKIWIPSLEYYLLPIQLSHCGLSSRKRDAKKKSSVVENDGEDVRRKKTYSFPLMPEC
jgi:hypothetical protein